MPLRAIAVAHRAGNGSAELIVAGAVRIIRRPRLRGMAQSGSAPALGAGSRGFKSLCPDQYGAAPGHNLETRP